MIFGPTSRVSGANVTSCDIPLRGRNFEETL